MKRQQSEFSGAKCIGVASLVLAALLWARHPAFAQTFTDDFNTPHDYQFGDTTGTIWTGMENIPGLIGTGVHDADTTNPDVLTVEDNGTFDADGNPANGISGMGWEGGRSTAPFLFRNVPAGQDFTATVKISAQTSGNWSAAGILARAGNSPTPPGVGADHADENFVTAYSFRTNAGIPDVGTTLQKRIENGAQVNDTQVNVNNPSTVPNPAPPPDTVSVPLNPLPTYVRLERVGGGTAYRTWVSSDGANWQFQSRVVPTAGNALRDAAVPMQVGLSYMNFGTLAGTTQFDDFSLQTYAPLAAPGAPSISTSETAFTVTRGTELEVLISNATGGQGPLSWVRTPNLPGADAMLPGANGGPASPLVPVPPENGSYFRWDTAAPTGTYMVNITATNDWGQASNSLELTITIIPEPASLALVSFALASFMGLRWRRR
ncbi:MAG TPA: hypothetical protein VJ828_18170 [Lacipirellulaceae bacterium]|nr:hypothetical protein [Lacipirellulaceae bacterium]